MLTGSAALDFYAQPRMTRDIDLVVELDSYHIPQFHRLFSPEFYLDESEVKRAVEGHTMFNAIHEKWASKVDFIIRKDLEYRKTEFLRRRQMELEDGSKLFVAAPEDLILSKLEWAKNTGSDFQKRDVRSLLALTHNLDYAYLNKWALALGISRQLEELKP